MVSTKRRDLMWSLRVKPDGSFFLTFDKFHRFTNNLRGSWQYVGPQGNTYTAHCVRMNKRSGYLCANDDEGSVRVLVLEN